MGLHQLHETEHLADYLWAGLRDDFRIEWSTHHVRAVGEEGLVLKHGVVQGDKATGGLEGELA